jgi:hypothetical protein
MLLWIIGLLVFAYFYLDSFKFYVARPFYKGRHLRNHNQKQAIRKSQNQTQCK